MTSVIGLERRIKMVLKSSDDFSSEIFVLYNLRKNDLCYRSRKKD